MNTKKIRQLTQKYFEGRATLEEEKTLRTYFRQEQVADDLQSYAAQFQYYEERASELPGEFNPLAKIEFEDAAMSPLEGGQSRRRGGMAEKTVTHAFRWPLRMAAGFLLLIIGFGAGRLVNLSQNASTRDVVPSPKVQQMRTALMSSEYDRQPSAGKRLAAVNASTQIPVKDQKMSDQISEILVYTMNNDNSVNVRIAAAEGLFRFRRNSRIQQALVNALGRQDDPLMQITLINMLVKLKTKGALSEMQQMLVDSGTQPVVRKRLKVGIAELQA